MVHRSSFPPRIGTRPTSESRVASDPGTRESLRVKTLQLTAVLEREAGGYAALCPEVDVASQGESVEEALRNLREAVELFLECAPAEEVRRRHRPEVIITRFEAACA
jgi:predicted RNase H-like HicB family nuclease